MDLSAVYLPLTTYIASTYHKGSYKWLALGKISSSHDRKKA